MTLRSIILLVPATLVLALVHSEQTDKRPDLAKKVSFSAPAMPANNLIRALSAQTGIPMNCSPAVAADVLLLHVVDTRLSDVLARLEEVTGATWLYTADGYSLRRTMAQVNAQELAEAQERAAEMRRGLAAVLQNLGAALTQRRLEAIIRQLRRAQETYDHMPEEGSEEIKKQYEDQTERSNAYHPTFRLAARCFQDIGFERIASIPVGSRVVYSNLPSRIQRSLGISGCQAVAACE